MYARRFVPIQLLESNGRDSVHKYSRLLAVRPSNRAMKERSKHNVFGIALHGHFLGAQPYIRSASDLHV
jgi:hypothetical protein